VLECGEARPSRYFGFTAVARRVEDAIQPAQMSAEEIVQAVQRTEQRRAHALNLITAEEERMGSLALQVVGMIQSFAKTPAIFVWAANIHATRLAQALKARNSDLTVKAVDSAVSKIGTLHEGFASPVIKPGFNANEPGGHLFLLCSPNWNSDIREQILSLGLPQVEIIDAITWKPAHA
jgi:hypothetical protein